MKVPIPLLNYCKKVVDGGSYVLMEHGTEINVAWIGMSEFNSRSSQGWCGKLVPLERNQLTGIRRLSNNPWARSGGEISMVQVVIFMISYVMCENRIPFWATCDVFSWILNSSFGIVIQVITRIILGIRTMHGIFHVVAWRRLELVHWNLQKQ